MLLLLLLLSETQKNFDTILSSLLKSFIHSIFLGQVSVFWGLTSWKYGRIMGWEEKIPLFLVSKNFFTFFRLNPERFGGDFKEEVQVSLTCWFYFIQSFLFSISYVSYVDSQLKSTSHKYFESKECCLFQVHSGFLSAYDSVRNRIMSLIKLSIGFV